MLTELREKFPVGMMLTEEVTVTSDEEGTLTFHGERGFRVDGGGEGLAGWVRELVSGVSWYDLDRAEDRHPELLRELAARGMLVAKPPTDEPGQLTRQLRWLAHRSSRPDEPQATIAAHRAVILGCGGIGCLAATHLAAMGVGELALVDHDLVEITNFNRQLTYRRSDLGRPKAEALGDFLAERYPATEVSTLNAFVDTRAALEDNGLVGGSGTTLFCCADRPAGTLSALVARVAREHGTPVLFAAAGLTEAAVGPLLTADGTVPFTEEMDRVGTVAGRSVHDPIMGASLAPVNTVAAAWMVFAWLNGVILRRPEGTADRRLVLDLERPGVREERTWK
ncbi:ThiF family adenylyltransferase [Streptosporangium sp. NPDC023615]|uniref:ThiF family adenylyltransferase n=1 Tax=Streptosporangium sp. NPDC023615 TaxID=3154794 RepID=UPI00341C48B1